jgi:hypothetical protein
MLVWGSIVGIAACTGYAAMDELELEDPEPPPDAVRQVPPTAAVDDRGEPRDGERASTSTRRRRAARGIPADARIVLQRTACMGPCPIYEVTLFADGEVRWRGDYYVETIGDATGSTSRAKFAELWRDLAGVQFDELPGHPRERRTFCTSYVFDIRGAVVTIAGNGTEHVVIDDHGCGGWAPLAAFRSFEDRIDAVAGSKRWVGRCADSPCELTGG